MKYNRACSSDGRSAFPDSRAPGPLAGGALKRRGALAATGAHGPPRDRAPHWHALACFGGVYALAMMVGVGVVQVESGGREQRLVVAMRMAADPGHEALLTAIDSRDAGAVAAVLRGRGAGRVNAVDKSTRTPLGCAIRRTGPGNRDVVRALLAGGADPNLADVAGGTPLAEAVRFRGDDVGAVVGDLLRAGADPGGRGRRRQTPLHWAAIRDDHDASLITLLLDAGADPSAADDGGETPLDWATGAGNHAGARLLREAAAR
jgi:ankyrin repeat protein